MGTFIWQAAGPGPADIQINLDRQGKGWFTLSADEAGRATDLYRQDPADGDGDAYFRVTPNHHLKFKMQTQGGYAGAASCTVWHKVMQSGVILPCMDGTGAIINRAAGEYGGVALGDVAPGKVLLSTFQIWE